MLEGWHTIGEVRRGGGSIGHIDVYFFSGLGQRFRSRRECLKHLGFDPDDLRLKQTGRRSTFGTQEGAWGQENALLGTLRAET